MNEIGTPTKSSCKKGCSFCCHINVDILESEAKLIFEYLGNKGIYKSIKWDVLKSQKSIDLYERPKIKDSACAFLSEIGECSIYEVRPISCRKFFVVSDPLDCDASKNDNGKSQTIQIQTVLDYEIISSVLNIKIGKIGLMSDKMLELKGV